MIKYQKAEFEVIQGGKDSDFPITKTAQQPPSGIDWLRNLPDHTRFVSQHKTNKGSRLDTYGIAAILDFAILLYDFNNPMGPPMFYVLSDEFSKANRLIGVLPNPPKEEEENDEHHLSVPEPRTVDD